jgi:WD40 repeat protein
MLNRIHPVQGQRIHKLAGILLLLTLLLAGCTNTTEPEKPFQGTISTVSSTNTPGTIQQLRISNQSGLALHNLVVVFPNERIEFGDVAAGVTTDFKTVSHGVYRYAAYNVEVNGQKYAQPVTDWIGETQASGVAFTYFIQVDPSKWPTEGQVIQLSRIQEDQPNLSLIPTFSVTKTEKAGVPELSASMTIGEGFATSLTLSPDGQWMAVGTYFAVYLYKADTFKQAWSVPLPDKAERLVFDPQSQTLAVESASTISILDVHSGAELGKLVGANGSIAWSPDGQRLVSSSGCEQVTVWNAKTSAALKIFGSGQCSEGYSGLQPAWSADGRIYAVSMGTQILAWIDDSYTPLADFSAKGVKDTWISAIVAAPAGHLLAQYDSMGGNIIAIIDTQQDLQVHLLDQKVNGPISVLSWAPDGQHLAVAYGMDTGLILIWNAQTGQEEQRIVGLYASAGLGWSSDGKILYGAQTIEGQIYALEVSGGKVLRSLDVYSPAGTFMTWTQAGLVSAYRTDVKWWNPASGELLHQETIGTYPEGIISWPSEGPGNYLTYHYSASDSVYRIGRVSLESPTINADKQNPVPAAWSGDGSRLASPTVVWNADTGSIEAQLNDPAQQHFPDQVAWSPDDQYLAMADSLNMQPPVIWDAHSGNILLTLTAHTGNLEPIWLGLAWSPDGEKLAGVGALMNQTTGASEGMILVWDAKTGQQLQLLTAGMEDLLEVPVWSRDSRFLACATTGSTLFIWDMHSQKLAAILQGHRDIVDRMAWSPDGKKLASISRDGTLRIWVVIT